MENTTNNLKNIEIEVEDTKIRIFERFPDFAPFVGDKYADSSTKTLLIWESYYDTKNRTTKYDKDVEGWYKNEKQEIIDEYFLKMIVKEKEGEHYNHWNFASKMHEDGIDRNSPTFQNIEKVLDKYSKEKNSFKYCAGYNYYLRPATNAASLKSKPLDEKIAAETLKAVIIELKPNTVIFFSKKGNASFKPYRKEFENVKFKAFVHPASPWWNRKSGKEQKSGKERFEEFLKSL